MGYYGKRIDKAFENAVIIDADSYPGIVFFSDCHRGRGTWNDSFLYNKIIYQAALDYYWQKGFAYVELGDGDELWENRDFMQIYEVHKDIFETLRRFLAEDRLYMIFGNHDKAKAKVNKYIQYWQSAIINSGSGEEKIYLLHGHQADIFNDRFWYIARWMVRYLWKPLELAGFKDPTSAARNYGKRSTVENRLIKWASKKNRNIMSGHTHRPTIINTDRIKYINTGSCVHPNGVTCIELFESRLRLIRWTKCVDKNSYVYVCRQVLKEMKL